MTVYFDCPDNPAPIGGIKQIYRQVDVLSANGIDAWVVHTAPGFRCGWFANDTPVTNAMAIRPTNADRIVVPESRPADEIPLHVRFPDVPRVVFNQNAYLTFKDFDLLATLPDHRRSQYEQRGTTAVVTVSADSERVLRFVFPHLDVLRIRCGIDPAVFAAEEPKERMIAFVAKKSKILREVLHCLRVRGSLADWKVVPIDNQPQSVVADVMRRSLVFLTAVSYEGFGLPPAEAMASGCLVAGFDGWGGAEYFTPGTGFPVPMGNLVQYVMTVEDLLRRVDTDRESLDVLRHRAAEFIATEYSLEREAASILAAWRCLG